MSKLRKHGYLRQAYAAGRSAMLNQQGGFDPKKNAMAVLLALSPEERIGCACGLLLTVADAATGVLDVIIELHAFQKTLSQRAATSPATGERKPGAVSPDNSGVRRGPSPRRVPVSAVRPGKDSASVRGGEGEEFHGVITRAVLPRREQPAHSPGAAADVLKRGTSNIEHPTSNIE